MEFTLFYDGALPANGSLSDKQRIRRVIHEQLRVLWQHHHPLNALHDALTDGHSDSVVQQVGSFLCAPLVNTRFGLVAELEMVMLRPEAPGSIVTQGGDIDNRLKTLLDALRMPKVPSEIPTNDTPAETERPLFCLLEDDNLVTSLAIRTDRLLVPEHHRHVRLHIRVVTKHTRSTWENIGL
jgi:hypothetical protein